MNTLCLMSNLTSAEWAAWVQAIGSVGAIGAAAWVAIHQSRAQQRSALLLHKAEQQTARIELARTLSVLATNSSKAMHYVAQQLKDREAVHRSAEGLQHVAIGELQRLDRYISEITIQDLPYSLVTLTIILGSSVRQFREKVEMALEHHRKMDAAMFEDFFRTLKEMNESIAATCKDIEAQIKKEESS